MGLSRDARVEAGPGQEVQRLSSGPRGGRSRCSNVVRRRVEATELGVRYYKNAEELLDRLTKLISTRQAGNTSAELRNEAADILDKLWDDREIDEPVFKGLWEIFE